MAHRIERCGISHHCRYRRWQTTFGRALVYGYHRRCASFCGARDALRFCADACESENGAINGEKMEITIDVLEKYLLERYGGWANEQGLFLKLVEEIGEVAEVINMKSGSKKAMDVDLQKELGTELADMIHYIVAIAAINHIDLTSIMLEKDKKASIKYNHSINLETFISAKHDE